MAAVPIGEFARNVVNFSRLLRAAGVDVGPDRTLTAIRAIEAVGVSSRVEVHAALSAVMLSRHEQQVIFDAAFEAFWRDPKLLERMLASLLPQISGRGEALSASKRPARLEQALAGAKPRNSALTQPAEDEVGEFDALMTWSDRERLQNRDFDSMTMEEFEQAQGMLRGLVLPIDPIEIRRTQSSTRGAISLRDTLRGAARDPLGIRVVRRAPCSLAPPLVILCDISGSMDRYARVMLHFAHALMQGTARVSVFTFGTRLTDITRSLRHRDPDEAMAAASQAVSDWQGGTRIGPCLDEFVKRYARRVLTGNAALLLVTDGLDRAEDGSLGQAAERLSRFARQFVWLNPLLRFEGFEPRASGVRALLPHVDRHIPVHSLASLADLARAIRQGSMPRSHVR
jgi:uncharacterized protein with von Willebrand factor type A (vWA) domain